MTTTKDLGRPVESTGEVSRILRRDAVGIEIPVTVHASRTNRGLDKALAPVHEETRTVIVLAQGAVVRMTATLVPGETVVLTNRQTGADVLCRVGKVKAQPGIQQYVDLEFTQRAPGFWGSSLPYTDEAVISAAPATAAKTPIAAQPIAPPPAARPPAPIKLAPVVPPVRPLIPTSAEVKSVPVAEPAPPVVAETASQPAALRPISSISLSAPAPRARIEAPPAPLLPAVIASLPLPDEPQLPARSGSKMGYLAVAAAALLVVGVAMGGWFYRQGLMSPSQLPMPEHQAAVLPDDATAQAGMLPFELASEKSPSQLSAGPVAIPVPASAPVAAAPPAPEPVVSDRPVSRRADVTEPARAPQRAVRRNNIAVRAVQPPMQRRTPAQVTSAAIAPPVVSAPVSGLGELSANSGLLGAGAAGPAPPRPTVGGQLQQPQLISSVPPVYPPIARAQRIEGNVVLDALVDESGQVVESKVVIGHQLLQSAAQQALRNWKYRPARLNGEPISIRTRVTIRFNLN
jgi:protein TonB